MKQETAKTLGDGAATLAVSTGAGNYLGWFDFINQNAAGIGVIISFLSFIVAVIFYVLTYKKPDDSRKNSNKIMELQAELDDAIRQIELISERKSRN